MYLAEGVAEARRVNEEFVSEEDAAAYWAEGSADAGEIDFHYPGADGVPRAARHYPGRARGTLLYMHGGGWSGGSIALNHRACRALSAQSGWDVVSISYRLAPEHPFPEGLLDCRAALNWVCDWGSDIGLNTERVACGGASAGGNLALALALGLHEAPLAGLLLFYPVTGSDFETKSYRRYADGYGLSRDRMQQLFAMYDPDGRRGREPELTPRSATRDQILKANMPPVAFISAECDVLAEDSRLMAAHLEAAGVSTMLHIEPGVTHGFINRGRLIPAAEACLSRAAQFLETLS